MKRAPRRLLLGWILGPLSALRAARPAAFTPTDAEQLDLAHAPNRWRLRFPEAWRDLFRPTWLRILPPDRYDPDSPYASDRPARDQPRTDAGRSNTPVPGPD